MERLKYKVFTASDAVELSTSVTEKTLNKGNVIDAIRAEAKKGNFSVTIPDLPENIASDLMESHGFAVNKNKISWSISDAKSVTTSI